MVKLGGGGGDTPHGPTLFVAFARFGTSCFRASAFAHAVADLRPLWTFIADNRLTANLACGNIWGGL